CIRTERRRIELHEYHLDALRSGDPRAAERIVSRYGERAYRLARRITGNGQDAEEVVQDAFWSVVRKIDTFRGDSAFGSWLYRIVADAGYQQLRCRPGGRRELLLDEVLLFCDDEGHVTHDAD